MTAPAGFLVWVTGTRGPEPQRWHTRPASVGTDYWHEKSGRVLLVVPLSAEEMRWPLDLLAAKHPAPAVTPDKGERTVLAGVTAS